MKLILTYILFTIFLCGDYMFPIEYFWYTRLVGLALCFFLCIDMPKSKQFPKSLNKYFVYFLFVEFILLAHILVLYYFGYAQYGLLLVYRSLSFIFQISLAISLAYVFIRNYGHKVFTILVNTTLIAYVVCVISTILSMGIIEFISFAFDFNKTDVGLVSASRFSIIHAFEIHSLGLMFPLFLLIDFIAKRDMKHSLLNKWQTILLYLFILTSMKRIAIVAALAVLIIFIYLSKRNDKAQQKLLKLVPWGIIGFSVVMLIFLFYTNFFEFIQSNHINLTGREYLYRGIVAKNHFGIDHIGKGYGWSSLYMQMMNRESNMFVGIIGLHNDILKLYCELGFVLFFVYIYIYFFKIASYLKNIDFNLYKYYLLTQIFVWITYLFDNTNQYADFQILAIVAPLCLYLFSRKFKMQVTHTNIGLRTIV